MTAVTLLDKWTLLQAIIADPKLSPTATKVAAVLLDCLNCKTGRCDPSITHLEDRVSRSRRPIGRAITELAERGWLTRTPRRGTTAYAFAFDRIEPEDDASKMTPLPADDASETTPLHASKMTPVHASKMTPVHASKMTQLYKTGKRETGKRETEKEETLSPLPLFSEDKIDATKEEPPASAFDEFWRAYPRKDAKEDARRAFAKAIKMTPVDEIIDGARRYAAGMIVEHADPKERRRFTKLPAGWLNGKRWSDEPPPQPGGPIIDQSGAPVLDRPAAPKGTNGRHPPPFISSLDLASQLTGLTRAQIDAFFRSKLS